MGKAKRQLNAARKEIFSEISRKYDPQIEIEDAYIDDEQENESENIIELSSGIREALFDYVDDMACPLCEYLDMNNIVNYVEWVLKHHL